MLGLVGCICVEELVKTEDLRPAGLFEIGDNWISQRGKTYGYQEAGQSICDGGAGDSDSEGEDDDDEGDEYGDDPNDIDDWGMLAEEDDAE